MDFVESEKPVPISAVLNESRLQRWFDTCNFCQIDIAAQKLAGGRLIIEFFYAAILEHHDPGLFRMGGIDKHLIGFVVHCDGVLGREIRARDPATGV